MFNRGSQAFVKVSNSSYGLFVQGDPVQQTSLIGSVPIIGGVRFYYKPEIALGINPETFEPIPNPIVYYNGVISSEGFANQGSDPVLGPPFPPIDYQLFIDTPAIFARTTGQSGTGLPAHLYWTVPDVHFSYSFLKGTFLERDIVLWIANTNNPAQSSPYYLRNTTGAPPVSGYVYSIWVSSFKYIWITFPPSDGVIGPAPVGGGTAPNGGNAFIGKVSPNLTGPFPYDPANIVWNFQAWNPTPTITGFSLSRSRGDSNFSDLTNGGLPSGIAVGTNTTGSFTIPAIGSTVNIPVENSALVTNGATIYIGGATTVAGLYTITAIPDGTHVTVQNIGAQLNPVAGTVIPAAQRVAGIGIADDPADRDPSTNYFYQLTGSTDDGFHFPFNVVGLIRAYNFTAQNDASTGNKTVLTWDRPDVSQWPV